MGDAYRANWKNLTGKPDVTARETIEMGATVASGGGSANLTDRQGISAQPAVRAARLEGASVVASSGLTAGTLSVALTVNNAVVASGDLTTGGVAYLDLILEKENQAAIALAAGATIRMLYNSVGLLGEAPTLSGRVHLSLLE
jgi:hypothetical protein